MSLRVSLVLGLIVGEIFLQGCTTTSSMHKIPDHGGDVQEYGISYKQAYDLALYAMQAMDFEVESNDFEKGYIVGKNGMSAMSYGERIGIYLKQMEKNRTEMRVVCKAKLKTNIFAPNWEAEVHEVVKKRIEQLKAAHLLTEGV